MFNFKACHFSCSNCLGPEINMCTICSDANNRVINEDSVCDCKQSYYEIGFSECACIIYINCLACSDICENCVNTADYCISCYEN